MAQHVKLKEGVSKMEEVIEWVMKFGHGVKGLSEMEMSNLPEQYIQPESERLSNMKMIIPSESHDSSIIPIIDMSNCDTCKDEYDPTLVKTVCEAAQKWGFFQIINHGVPAQALEDVKRATIAFFGLPPEEKRKYLKENSPSNHVRLSTSFIPDAETTLEWKDYLSLFYVSDEETLDIWPPICREQLLDYIRKCQVLIKPLAQMLMKGLNIDMVDEKKWSLLTGSLRINLNYYPKCPKPELTVGVGRHSDVSTFTILLQDNIGGLYVRAPDEESWVHVAPVAGALVINVGDALQILSNGKYKSIEHRVIANGSVDRISIPLFVNPNPNQVIGPLEEVLMQTGEKPKYKNVLYSDYTLHFYRKAHDGKATLEFVKK